MADFAYEDLLPVGADLPPYTDLRLSDLGIRLVEPDPPVAFVPE